MRDILTDGASGTQFERACLGCSRLAVWARACRSYVAARKGERKIAGFEPWKLALHSVDT